ncbi:multifunctional oxoglutarate decarboxylase/oxoglutarate dehydrogenase thiamine pyrophosphate-binding subunit/dihydrolipoyllysine-residue succinyltransferase subunit [Melioribacteraceae bacterium 4301-Me]|uniref:multifunctional oxoglutarate decarboxylase/oxoglutarate dehydrogenase thiamine pyrophosphate-binding subunit/dihydrolipoyllysine-residue succinyltransferase subunit n=1 Tax=Pyranulibacter aquaticus TaxID=3163344 RepID=UPI00359B1345
MKKQDTSSYHKELFAHFGYNFGFVADLLDKYFHDKNSVSEHWREYFDKLTENGSERSQEEKVSKEPYKKSDKKILAISNSFEISPEDEPQLITGIGAKIIENMNNSLGIPTATSLRTVSVKLLEENRLIINQHLSKINAGKVSFTHLVAYAIVKAVKKFPAMNKSFAYINEKPYIINKPYVNLGIAVDIERKDGTRSLIVPNIKHAGQMNFKQFFDAYNEIIDKAKNSRLEPSDFQGTTITLTNPGGIGTVSSTPRLMTGQGCIVAIGAIDYPAEFKAMSKTALASLGIGKVMNITSTYDHRIIQGAVSGEFLAQIDKYLLGEEQFYESIFTDLNIPQKPVGWGVDTTSLGFGEIEHKEQIEKQARILQLINMYRVRGHLIADLNPLEHKIAYHEELDPTNYGFTIWDYDRPFITGGLQGMETGTLRQILDVLHQTYCDKIGIEYMHIQNHDEKAWLQTKMEPILNKFNFSDEWKKRILNKLVIAEGFEHFLHTKFVGHKRFSLEGSETLIPVLDMILNEAAQNDVKEIFLGMAHRGRLNVLSNIIGKSYEKIFSEFEEDIDPDAPQGTGDVKYHLGASGKYLTMSGKKIKVSVASNPSHLEWVNPVVEGIVRAKQTRNNDFERNKYIPILIHGDAAFAGQGIVAETLNLSQLKGYRTGGTIHIIINNQIGFTTTPEEARSSPYATDVAKMVQSPIFHVNGDDPEAALWIAKLAFEYRQKFHKDIVIDLIGYRRHGHNEGDDPVYTQPIMYRIIKEHPSVKEIYSKKLISKSIITESEIEKLDKEIWEILERALKSTKMNGIKFTPDRPLAYDYEFYQSVPVKTGTKVPFEMLAAVVKGITKFPENFTLNPKLKKHIDKRKELLTGNARIDWAFAESLAFGTLLIEGRPIRLSGQDSARGTFSQRHLILTDMNTGEEIIPHNSISEGQAKLEPLDSLLSEAAVLGFEFGYSVADPLSLVIWEAQFGDFANGAQPVIDNFICSSFTKWQLPNNIVLLLPHGQEGQGPEHSSARLERFLILCAENNMFVCNPTTPAQYFHLLRRHVLQKIERPLVILTPKSLLRLPAARSSINDFTSGKFWEVIDDASIKDKSKIKNLIFTSGKIYYELISERDLMKNIDTAIIRIEQYYPFPQNEIKSILEIYPNAEKIKWVQEEPQNMGAWNFIYIKFLELGIDIKKIKYVGRPESPSPAPGSTKQYLKSQQELIQKAFR